MTFFIPFVFLNVLFHLQCKATGGKPVASQKIGPLNSPKVVPPLDSEEISDLQTEKQNPAIGVPEITNGQALDKSFIVPSIVPQESPAGKDSSFSAGESITFSRTKPGMLLRPAHIRKPSNSKYDAERLSTAAESESLNSKKSDLDSPVDPNVKTRLVSSDGARKSCEEKDCHIKTITGEIENIFSPQKPPKQEDGKLISSYFTVLSVYQSPCFLHVTFLLV